jgi:hypothetical protein
MIVLDGFEIVDKFLNSWNSSVLIKSCLQIMSHIPSYPIPYSAVVCFICSPVLSTVLPSAVF